jgi:hypothetical protein
LVEDVLVGAFSTSEIYGLRSKVAMPLASELVSGEIVLDYDAEKKKVSTLSFQSR